MKRSVERILSTHAGSLPRPADLLAMASGAGGRAARVRLPEDAVPIPGVITQSTVLVEHPELVAERIARFAGVVGRERVIAGADCGFASFAGSTEIPASVAWKKLAALTEGARLASRRLLGR